MKKILAFGEVLWDMIPSGKQVGGAPGNFAYHARAFGADARILSRIGNDGLGMEMVGELRKCGVPTDLIGLDTELPTGTVEVELDRNGQPKYRIIEDVAWDRIEAKSNALAFAASVDAVCFGTLAARSESNLRALGRILTESPTSALRVLDLNLRAPFYSKELIYELLPLASVLKVSDSELITLGEIAGRPLASEPFLDNQNGRIVLSADKYAAVHRLITDWRLKYLILTCGGKGSFLFDRNGNESYAPAAPTKIVSTVGAGDAFTAAATIGFLEQRDLAVINRAANRYAAYVCSEPGGMPPIPKGVAHWDAE